MQHSPVVPGGHWKVDIAVAAAASVDAKMDLVYMLGFITAMLRLREIHFRAKVLVQVI